MQVRLALSEPEERLFELLRDVVRQSGCGSVLRVAGGWVRDKIMGRESNDIDVVVDNMSGAQFAALLTKHRSNECRSFKVIAANPELHKHIETATLKVLDIPIEVAALQQNSSSSSCSSSCSSSSSPSPPSPPSSSPSSIAKMDALRRDLTINSLFYNINEDRVEDFTGTGISDLKEGLLRTPLPAMTTLMEDPLRAMRCLRFATRFDGFKLDDELCAAIQDPAIRHELQNNISRERIATELNKLMTGPLPIKGLELLCGLNLHTIVFSPVPSQPEFWSESMTELALSSVRTIYERCKQETNDVPLKVVLLSSFFLPLFRCVDKAASDKVGFSKLSKKEQDVYLQQQLVPFTKFHMQERWMFTHKEVTLTFALLSLAEQFLQLVSAWSAQLRHERSFDRLSAGKLLRESGPKWSIAFELAQLKHCLLLSNETASTVFHSSPLVSVYESYKQLLLDEGLLGEQPVWEMPLLFQGGELMKALSLTKPGPIVGLLKEKAIEWQILHPGGTPEQCLLSLSAFLQQHK